MRLYRIKTPDGRTVNWAGTQADAKASAKELNCQWAEEEVPTDKPGLLIWLRQNATKPDAPAGE